MPRAVITGTAIDKAIQDAPPLSPPAPQRFPLTEQVRSNTTGSGISFSTRLARSRVRQSVALLLTLATVTAGFLMINGAGPHQDRRTVVGKPLLTSYNGTWQPDNALKRPARGLALSNAATLRNTKFPGSHMTIGLLSNPSTGFNPIPSPLQRAVAFQTGLRAEKRTFCCFRGSLG